MRMMGDSFLRTVPHSGASRPNPPGPVVAAQDCGCRRHGVDEHHDSTVENTALLPPEAPSGSERTECPPIGEENREIASWTLPLSFQKEPHARRSMPHSASADASARFPHMLIDRFLRLPSGYFYFS